MTKIVTVLANMCLRWCSCMTIIIYYELFGLHRYDLGTGPAAIRSVEQLQLGSTYTIRGERY